MKISDYIISTKSTFALQYRAAFVLATKVIGDANTKAFAINRLNTVEWG